ncbi:MAG TPA: signal recognition particle protein, partial [Clostridia bacterium]|nr:signal recognition particle protein [Clostridia bacterium]
MAFEGLSEKLQNIFSRLSRHGKLSEKDVNAAMREIKIALLEADVNIGVVREFIAAVSKRALGQEILSSLTPAQQVIKIVNEELTALMGSSNSKLAVASNPPTVIMLVGLQGSGKTSMAGKLSVWLKKNGKNPLLAACDIYRPAAIDQLKIVGSQAGAPVFEKGVQNPVITASEAYKHARLKGYDTLIIDTAGRLHIDDELMNELAELKSTIKPHEILLVVDAMTGQDAVNVAKTFNERLGIDGIVLTKLDGDTRGGAALSAKAVTGKPVKFTGVGEKIGDLEPFYPDRMASRILGMGDILSLIEKAQEQFDENAAREMEKKYRSGTFDLNDYL